MTRNESLTDDDDDASDDDDKVVRRRGGVGARILVLSVPVSFGLVLGERKRSTCTKRKRTCSNIFEPFRCPPTLECSTLSGRTCST